jgi:hypothetical protein
MKRWFGPASAMLLLLLLALPATPAGAVGEADTQFAHIQFAHIQFADQARMVMLTIPTPACRHSSETTAPCNWELFVDEPFAPGQPVVGAVSGSSGVLSVPYPSFCGVLQADALVGSPPRREVGYRHVINTCDPACVPPLSPWTNTVSGTFPVRPHAPQGVYLGEVNNDWTLYVTHRHAYPQWFTGTITTDGTFSGITGLKLEGHDHITQVAPNQIQFRFLNRGYLDGMNFTSSCASQATFNLSINGSPAPPSQIFLGPAKTPAASSPVTFMH